MEKEEGSVLPGRGRNAAIGESSAEGLLNLSKSRPLPSAMQRGEMAQKVRASHILVKHVESRRPSSWKEPVVTRPKARKEEETCKFGAARPSPPPFHHLR